MFGPIPSLGAYGMMAVGVAFASGAEAASFDCRKATTPEETAICADPLLSRLDDDLARAYAEAKADFADEAVRLDRDFLHDRASCGGTRACLMATMVGVLARFAGYGASPGAPDSVSATTIAGGPPPRSPRLPATLGACTASTVAAVGPRLADGDRPPKPEDFDTGTHVTFANTGYQVSYDREPKLLASRPGDLVAMCLVSIPHRCPKGDDRGRFYTVTNARTGQTWTLPDSQHMCGGA